jgi:hypothetical protein
MLAGNQEGVGMMKRHQKRDVSRTIGEIFNRVMRQPLLSRFLAFRDSL